MDIAVRDDDGTAELPAIPSPGSTLDRRRRLVLAAALIAALVSTSGLVASAFVKSPAQVAADSSPPAASVLTAPVERRILKSTLVLRGTVTPGFSVDVTPTSSAAATRLVVTALRARAGTQLAAGDVLIEVSGRPIIALPGAVPAYRDLKPGDDGKDIAELQDALRSLGLPTGSDIHGHFGSGTKTGVSRLYDRLGYDVPTTGGPHDAADQESLRTAQDAVTAATRQRDAARAALATVQQQGKADAITQARAALTQAQQDLDRAGQRQAGLIAQTGPMLPLSEFVFVPQFPVRLATLTAKVGDVVSAPLLTIEGGQLVVQAILQPNDGSLIKTGMPAAVDSELLGSSATGRVTGIGALVAQAPGQAAGGNQANGNQGGGNQGGGNQGGGNRAGGNQGGGNQGTGGQTNTGSNSSTTGYPMTVTPDGPLTAAWSGQDVRLTIEAASTSGPVLVVPLAAVSAGADGVTMVTVLDAGGARRRVPVRAGVSGSGYVEISPVNGGVLAAGNRVVVGQ
jgi:multidrug efflux pump subunit AcrA (membrane-fusion protein)